MRQRPPVALVDEARCVGCVRCIEACPVDAIVGAQGLMHTVVEDWCIGCRLCVAPCPVDCIDMVARTRPWTAELKRAAGRRARAREARLARQFAPVGDAKALLAAILGRKR
jgi:electron transport complex protein RnfB